MRLPAISVILTSIAIFWCLAGVMIHGWSILVYPLVWLAIGSTFFVYHTFLAQPAQTQVVEKVQLENPNWSQPVVETPQTVVSSPQAKV